MIIYLNWILAYFGLMAIPVKGKLLIDEPCNVDLILHYITRFDELQADGEWKAHQVFASLVKKLPDVPKSKIRLDMELVYQKFKHG